MKNVSFLFLTKLGIFNIYIKHNVMDLEIFKLEDKSGRMSKEKFVSKNYPEEYKFIIEFFKEKSIENIPFKERVYLILHNKLSIPKCKNDDCFNYVKFQNSTLGYREYCSTKCISSDPKIKNIKKQKSIDKFGTETPAQSKVIKDKIIETNQKKWGSNSPMCNDEIKNKSIQTLIKNYGVDNPSKSESIKKIRIESFKKNVESYKENYKKTSLLKYGVDHPWKNSEIHKKTMFKFYENFRERIIEKVKNTNFIFIDFQKERTTNLIFRCSECIRDFSILTYQFYYRMNSKISICTNCFPISDSSSISQSELLKYIQKKYEGRILENSKKIIEPFEIDIFLPELNLAFEFNGVWWHSEKFKNKNYHKQKLELCQEKGIKLITIWEDDWLTKREICESFISNKMNLSNKIFARKCEVKEIDYKSSKKFLEENHFQGDCKSSVRVGLFFEENLISLMTFSKLRLPLGGRNREGYWELTRFCNRINYTVIGGASKLLNYFIKKYTPCEIQTYSDNLISEGDMYQKLGFEYQHTSEPGYWYVIDGIREHRFNWRKDKLKKLGADLSKSESQIMLEWGYYKIWNGGNRKWILNFEK